MLFYKKKSVIDPSLETIIGDVRATMKSYHFPSKLHQQQTDCTLDQDEAKKQGIEMNWNYGNMNEDNDDVVIGATHLINGDTHKGPPNLLAKYDTSYSKRRVSSDDSHGSRSSNASELSDI